MVHLVGFTIELYHYARPYKRQKLIHDVMEFQHVTVPSSQQAASETYPNPIVSRPNSASYV
jgi:hypothetical protein